MPQSLHPAMLSVFFVVEDIWYDETDSSRGYMSTKLNTMWRSLPQELQQRQRTGKYAGMVKAPKKEELKRSGNFRGGSRTSPLLQAFPVASIKATINTLGNTYNSVFLVFEFRLCFDRKTNFNKSSQNNLEEICILSAHL